MMVNKVGEVRKCLGLSQEELARDAGISRVYLSKIETGRSTPTYPIVYRLSKRLRKPAEELFFSSNGNYDIKNGS